MGDGVVRPRWRDALFVTVLAIVLFAGLIHYGLRLSDGDDRLTAEPQAPAATPTSGPRGQAAATLESAPATDPTDQATTARGTCWDGRSTVRLTLCGLPDGARGLEWVFPSFRADRTSCHRSRRVGTDYALVASFVCFEHALGHPVTVTYDQAVDPTEVERWMDTSPDLAVTDLPGAHGGRCLATDFGQRPSRITGAYERFPYVVSVFAPTKNSAKKAWKKLVEQRPAQSLRGVQTP